MKKNLTFIFLWLTFMISAQSNQGTINVNVEDGCERLFTAPVTIDLYQLNNNTPVKIATSNTHPAEFTNLDKAASYEVRLSSSEVNQREPTVKDLFVMREIILGIQPFTLPSIFAGDMNNNGGISTLDLVMMGRHLVHIQPLKLEEWVFIDQNNIMDIKPENYNKTLIQGIPNGERTVTFNGYKRGAVESTVNKYCGSCIQDSLSKTSILFDDVTLEAGREAEFEIKYDNRSNDIGFQFSLKLLDADFLAVDPLNTTNFYYLDSIKTIHLFKLFEPLGSGLNPTKVVKLKIKPKRSGKISSFFIFNRDFKLEFFYKDGNCLKSYKEVNINNFDTQCTIAWPPDVLIPDCNSTYYTGFPSVSSICSNIVTFAYTDQVFGVPCERILRTWTGVNWLKSDIYTHTQIILIEKAQILTCINSLTMVVRDSAELWVEDIIKTGSSDNEYSFSKLDPNLKKIKIYNLPPYTFDVMAYDHTDRTFCLTKINIVNNGCTDPVKVLKEVAVKENMGKFTVEGELFNAGNQNHCKGQITDFQIRTIFPIGEYENQLIFDFEDFKGTKMDVDLRYKVNGTWEYFGVVKINFLKEANLPPFELSCYDDPVTKNVLHEISFFSPTFDNIHALQAAIRLKDAIYVSTRKVALSDMKFNEELRSLRFVWLLPSASPLTLSDKDTLFTITILPTQSGNISDILSVADDLLVSEAILNDFDQTRIDLVFKFLRRPTATQDFSEDNIIVFPNPSQTGQFFVGAPDFEAADIMVYDQNGQALSPSFSEHSNGKLAVTMPDNAPNGLYILKAQNDKVHSVKKIVLLR